MFTQNVIFHFTKEFKSFLGSPLPRGISAHFGGLPNLDLCREFPLWGEKCSLSKARTQKDKFTEELNTQILHWNLPLNLSNIYTRFVLQS